MFISEYRQTTAVYGYDDLTNTRRLRKCLQGEAKRNVQHLTIYPQNAEEVIRTLHFAFGRPEQLVGAQLRRARALKPIGDHELDQLVPFALTVQSVSAFLNNEDTRHYLSNPELLEELVGKLPPSQRINWGLRASQLLAFPTICDFSVWVMDLAHYARIATSRASSTVASDNRRGTNRSSKSDYVLAVTTTDDAPKCSTCDKIGHTSLNECEQFKQMSVDDRWKMAIRDRRCFSCLKPGHATMNCQRKRRCGIRQCTKSHNRMLHKDSAIDASESSTILATNEAAPSEASANDPTPSASSSTIYTDATTQAAPVLHCKLSVKHTTLFRTLPVVLHSRGVQVKTYAMFDEAASVTLLDEELAQQLQLTGKQEPLRLQWYGADEKAEPSRRVSVEISAANLFAKRYALDNVRTVNNITLPTHNVDVTQLTEVHQHLRNLPIACASDVRPKLLIGLEHMHLGQAVEEVRGPTGGPTAARTKLGWLVYGPCDVHNGDAESVLVISEPADTLDDLHQTVKDYFTTENFGVKHTEHNLLSKSDQRARDILAATTKRIGPRFETGLLWRCDDVQLPESRQMAISRLRGVEKKMLADENYAARYIANIDDYIAKGYARKLTVAETAQHGPRTWYLPHFGVLNPSKPDKLRLVFDAAATVNGVSLNSFLLTGPDQLLSLPHIMSAFRMSRIGVCGDIKEMFHQIQIRPADRDSQRFLWRRGDVSKPIDTYVMDAMTFGAACSPCSAQHVKNTNADEHANEHPRAAQAIKERHYVDDYVMSFETPEEAIDVTQAVIKMHMAGGFLLRNFVSNSPDVLAALSCGNPTDAVTLPNAEDTNEKILGMYWSTNDDVFTFAFRCHRIDPAVLSDERSPTKREMLSITMSTFDPFGILGDLMLHAKLMLQDLWKTGIGWDEPVQTTMLMRWRLWLAELKCISRCRVPRCYSVELRTTNDLQLHVFADASESAFACVAYWRVKTSRNTYEVSFVAGKTRCAPTKLLSIPRLELQAAVLATRLLNNVLAWHNEVKPNKVVLWTDSKTVMSWIHSDHRRYKSFVAHRVAEILETTDERNWRWISTIDNVADDATRAKHPPKFDPESRWLRGPRFLQVEETLWAAQPDNTEQPVDDAAEVRPCFVNATRSTDRDIFGRFSSFLKLQRTAGWCVRFTRLLNKRISKAKGELTVHELHEGEKLLCRLAQAEMFATEINALMTGKTVSKTSSIYKLSPWMGTDMLVRINGRLSRAPIEDDAEHPIILTKRHALTELLIAHYHKTLRHQNQEAVMSAVRQRYWVPHLRAAVRQAAGACMLCRHRAAQPAAQIMGQLPEDRVTPNVRPFTFTGLDYFGPVNVAVGRRREKRWVALFTCLTIRAVHLELAHDLSTDACILCIRNFVNVRGVPRRIRSDNGTNFVGATTELQNAVALMDQDALQRECTSKGIEWLFNCPANPEAGGCWERMVRSIKKVLSVTLQEAAPHVETLRSHLIDAANVVNSRPLTHVAVDSAAAEPLTPNHFLVGAINSTLIPAENEVKLHCLRKQWRISQQLSTCFWRRWVLEYLPELTRRTKWHADVPSLKTGDLVVIVDETEPRGKWRRGIVEAVHSGRDGRVRQADVRTSTGTLRRPATKLAVLDIATRNNVEERD